MPSNEDVDLILGKLSLPGRSPPTAPPSQPPPPPPGSGGGSAAGVATEAGNGEAAEDQSLCRQQGASAAAAAAAYRREKQAACVGTRRKEDIVLQRHSRPVTFVRLNPKGNELFTCGKDKVVIAWSCPEGEPVRFYEGHRGAVWACSLNADGTLLLSCGADSSVILWDVASAEQLAEVPMPGVVRCVEWAPSLTGEKQPEPRFAVCSNSFKQRPAALALMEFESSLTARCLFTVEEPVLPSGATQVAWAGYGGSQLCTVHGNGELLFWHGAASSLLGRLEAHKGPVSQLSFTSDRCLMASCGREDMQVKIWSLGPGVQPGQALLLRCFQSDRPMNAVALRPSLTHEDLDAAAGVDIRRCDCLAGGGQDARDVALVGAGTDDQFDPQPLCLGGGDGGLEEYVPPGYEERGKGSGHFGPIHALAFSADSQLCISAAEDGNVRLRDLSADAGTTAPQGAATTQVSTTHASQNAATKVAAAPAAAVHTQQPTAGQGAGARRQPPCQPPPQAAHAAPQPTTQAQPATQATQEGKNTVLRAVAICDFDPACIGWPPQASQRPLPLRRGQELEVVQDVGSGWSWGHSVDNSGMLGLFPTSYALPLSRYKEMLEAAADADRRRAEATAAAAVLQQQQQPQQPQPQLQSRPAAQPVLAQSSLLQSAQGQSGVPGPRLSLEDMRGSLPPAASADDEEDGDCAQS